MTVAPSDLLKGAWYSLEQSGHLLQAAVTLYNAGDYSTAVGVAMIAREELGKHMILRDKWKKSTGTSTPASVEDVRRACQDHVEKQRRGQLSVTFRTEAPSALDTALRARVTSKPGEPAFLEAEAVIRAAVEAKSRQAPAERHDKRLEGFYVDIDDSGKDWNRPSESMSQKEAGRLLNEAVTDYAGQQDRFSHPALLDDPQLAKAIEGWLDKPALPPPRWPTSK